MIQLINIGYSKESGITMKLNSKILSCTMALLVALTGCRNSAIFDCDKELKSSVTSPDGKHTAGILAVQCGATTADATWILLADAGEEYDYDRDKVAIFEGSNIKLNWSDSLLQVAYYKARPFKMDPSANGVSIEYQNKAP